MPANLGTLAPELLYKITEFFFIKDDQPVPQLYLLLAQVNRRFYDVFMSDPLWKRLDVHGVEKDISKHYIKRKAKMSSKELDFCGRFDFEKWLHPRVELPEFYQFSIYTQASILAESHMFLHEDKKHLFQRIGTPDLLFYAARTLNGLYFAKKSLKQDVEFMFKVADAGGAIVFFASEALRDDKDFILKCAASKFGLRDSSERLKNDKDVVLAHLTKWGDSFDFVSETLRDDPEVATAAIAKDPYNLRYCSDRLKNDPTLVKMAVTSDGATLQHASARLRNNLNLVLAAVDCNCTAFQFASKACQDRIVKLAATTFKSKYPIHLV